MKLHGQRATIVGFRVLEVEPTDLFGSSHRLAAAAYVVPWHRPLKQIDLSVSLLNGIS